MVTGGAWAPAVGPEARERHAAVGFRDWPERDRGAVRVSRWAPGLDDGWAGLVDGTGRTNLGQLPQWFVAIERAYGHAPVYLRAEDAAGRRAVLPSFLVRNSLFG
jgi:hypothetical protein